MCVCVDDPDDGHRPKSAQNQATGRDTNTNLIPSADALLIPLDSQCSASGLTARDIRSGESLAKFSLKHA